MNELVSIIVPIYNVEKYMDRCLESIVNQTYRNLEIILVDDGSPDNCPAMCDEWARRDSRIRVIHKANAGPGMARNSGLEIATGEYLMFADSDDYISKDAVQILLRRMIIDESEMALGKHLYVFPGEKIEQPGYSNWSEDTLMESTDLLNFAAGVIWPVEACFKLYRREVWENVSFPVLECGEDLWLYPRILKKCKKVSLVNHVVYYYYQRDNSITHVMTEKQRKDELMSTLNMVKEILNAGFMESAGIWFRRAIDKASHIIPSHRDGVKMIRRYLVRCERWRLLNKLGRRMQIKWIVMNVPYVLNILRTILKKYRDIREKSDVLKSE